MVVLLALLFIAQFLISGGFAAFGIVSRLHEDAAFPPEMRGRWFARFMHRGRLHFILSLLGLETVVLSAIAVIFHRIIGADGSWQQAALTIAAIMLSLTAITVAGFGVASRNPVRFAVVSSYPFLPVYLVFRPVAALFLRVVSRAFPTLHREMASSFYLFPGASGSPAGGFIEDKGSRLIRSIQAFGVKRVREVMVPRIDVFAIDIHTPLDEVRERVSSAGHSRVPVYDGSIDTIVGLLHVKDIIKGTPAGDGRLDRGWPVREAPFVPESKKISDLLREFQRNKKHMAIVVDEYGGTAGIVTLEDILEEIVGEILDEYDHELPLVRAAGAGQYVAAGWVTIDHLNAALGVSLPLDEVDTLGGFLYNLIGRVPEEGEQVESAGIRFRINRLEGQRIVEVTLWVPER